MSNDNLPIAKLVRESYANALENGYDFAGMSDDAIAGDMIDCDADIADYALDAGGPIPGRYDEIVAAIKAVRA